MRESINKNGFTAVDHTTFDQVLPSLPVAAQAVFLRIYRQTAGWNKPYDEISLSQFKKTTGIKGRETVSKAIRLLEERKLIVVLGEETEKRSYGIDWDEVAKYVPWMDQLA